MVESVAVVIVSYRAGAHLLQAVASVRDAAQVIVVDNDPSDGAAAAVAAAFPFVTIITAGQNLGFGRAVNLGVKHARAAYVLLLNPDAHLPRGGLSMLVGAYRRAAKRYGRIGALAAAHVDQQGDAQLSFGPAPTVAGELARKWVQDALDATGTNRQRVAQRALQALTRTRRMVAWASGSCLLVQRRDFRRIGGFDPRYFLYFEDVDFCLRLSASGLPIIFDPAVRVTHQRGISAKQAPALVRRAYRQGQILTARRWQSPVAAWVVTRLAQWRARAP